MGIPRAPNLRATHRSSPARTVEGIIRAAEASAGDWGPLTGLNLPSMRTTVGEMAAALEMVAGRAGSDLLDWQLDPAIQRLVDTWPGDVQFERARGLGLTADASFEQIVRDYVRDNVAAVKLPVR